MSTDYCTLVVMGGINCHAGVTQESSICGCGAAIRVVTLY